MKNDNWAKILTFSLLFLFAGGIGMYALEQSRPAPAPTHAAGDLGSTNVLYNISTSSSATVGNIASNNASSTLVLPANSGRTWAIISNNTGFPIFCNLDGLKGTSTNPVLVPSTTAGFIIAASSTYVMSNNFNGVFAGNVICASQGGTSTVFTEQGTQ